MTFEVKQNDNATEMAPRLVKLGVIKAASPFISAAKASPNAGNLTPGTYRLRKHMNAGLAWALFFKPESRIQTTVTITDGQRNTVDGVLASLLPGRPAGRSARSSRRSRTPRRWACRPTRTATLRATCSRRPTTSRRAPPR